MTSYRIHTMIVGRNLPVIIQHLPTRPAMDAMPLLKLMLLADAGPLEDEAVQAIAGPDQGS